MHAISAQRPTTLATIAKRFSAMALPASWPNGSYWGADREFARIVKRGAPESGRKCIEDWTVTSDTLKCVVV
ncbi:MAG: hypothetical protein AAFN27_24105, partial [Pseudomonadota bacterium]